MQDATVARRRVLSRGPVIVLVVLAYVGVLHYAYVNDIAPIFTYLQYGYRPPDPYYYAVAIAWRSSSPCSCHATSSARHT